MKKLTIFLVLFLSIIFFSGCGKTPSEARKEIASLNIEFSQAEFIKRVVAGDKSAVKLFLAADVDVDAKDNEGMTALMWAIFKGDLTTAELLIDKGADINAKNKDGETILISAIMKEDTATVKLLIDKGADVNLKCAGGMTALNFIGLTFNKEIEKLLIKAKGAK